MQNIMPFADNNRSTEQVGTVERKSWLRLARTKNVGPITFNRLIERFGSAEKAIEALPEMSKKGGRKKPLTAPPMNEIEAEIASVQKMDGKFLLSCDPDYPLSLAVLEDAPSALTILGNPHLLSRQCIGMVGARNASLNGRKMAEKLARDIGKQGEAVVVSGLARGIDAAAHTGALEGGTVAVVGGGADVIYPRENTKLYEDICERGVIVAENPIGWKPRAQDFPRRNRIISGLSLGVIVVEATLRSGSLITARLAAEQGRDVYAVPGFPGDPRAQGPNTLIKDGAILVQDASDVIENMNAAGMYSLNERHQQNYKPDVNILSEGASPGELDDQSRQDILDNLSYAPIAVDELARSCQLNISSIQEALLELELAGRLTRHPGNRVSLNQSDDEGTKL